MPYYETIDEDLARAREILEKGKADVPAFAEFHSLPDAVKRRLADGGTIFGADIYAAYKLLESFVAEIARLQVEGREWDASFRLYDKASRALMEAYKRAHPDFPKDAWPDATAVNVWAAAQIAALGR